MAGRKYVSDYRLEESLTPSGRMETKRVYRGEYYRYQESPECIRKLRLRILLVCVAVIVLMLPMLLTNSDLGRTIYVVLPVAASFVPLYLLLAGARRLGFPDVRFTREHRDKTERRIARSNLLLSIFLGIGSVGSVVFCFRRSCSGGEVFCVISLVLGWICAMSLLPWRKKAHAVPVEAKDDQL